MNRNDDLKMLEETLEKFPPDENFTHFRDETSKIAREKSEEIVKSEKSSK